MDKSLVTRLYGRAPEAPPAQTSTLEAHMLACDVGGMPQERVKAQEAGFCPEEFGSKLSHAFRCAAGHQDPVSTTLLDHP